MDTLLLEKTKKLLESLNIVVDPNGMVSTRGEQHHVTMLKYHESWDWIMPVLSVFHDDYANFEWSLKQDRFVIVDEYPTEVYKIEDESGIIPTNIFDGIVKYIDWFEEHNKPEMPLKYTIDRQTFMRWYFETKDTSWVADDACNALEDGHRFTLEEEEVMDHMYESDWDSIDVEMTNEYDDEIHSGMRLRDIEGYEIEVID